MSGRINNVFDNSYQTSCNGYDTFLVKTRKGEAVIFNPRTKQLVKKYKFETVFVGEEDSTVLLKLSKLNYVYIGERIVEFSTPEEIVEFHSPIGNSAVPYPFALSATKIYFLLESCCAIPRSRIPEFVDEYNFYYKHLQEKYENIFAKNFKIVKSRC